MIRSRAYVPVNQNLEERPADGLELFDCAVNEDDIHRYISDIIPAHWHRELEVFSLLSGSVRINICDRSYELSAGEGCIINTGILHSFTALSDEPCRFRSFVFDAGILSGSPGSVFDVRYVRPYLSDGAACITFAADDKTFSDAFDAGFSVCESEKDGYEFTVRNALSSILLHAREKSGDVLARSYVVAQVKRIKKMLAWIDEHIESEISIGDIASAAHVCPRVCQRLFKQYLHCRPMEYCMQKRIVAAAWLLSSTDEPVTSIAARYYFSSPGHFSQRFRALTGCTPSEYRIRMSKG